MNAEEELEPQQDEFQLSDLEDEHNDNQLPELPENIDMKLDQGASSTSACVRKKTLNKPHPRKQTQKTPWNSDEKEAINKTLSKYFSLNRLPGKAEIEEVKRSEPALQKRPWRQIKFFIKNSKDSEKRKMLKACN